MNYIVLDMEWNQPLSRMRLITEPVKLFGEIIQIGAVKLDSSFRVKNHTGIIVSPEYYTEMNQYVSKLTGISTTDLAKGKRFPEAFKEFTDWCGDDYCFITWGPDDIAVLRSNMILHAMNIDSLPVHYNLQLIFNKQITGENRQWSLTAAMEKLGLPLNLSCHDAENDAIYTARICNKLDMKTGISEYVAPVPKPKKTEKERYSFLRKHLIYSSQLQSGSNILKCPKCGAAIDISKRLRLRNRDKVFTGTCPKHGEYLIILKRKSGFERNIIYEENVYPLNESTDRFFHRMQLKVHSRANSQAK